MPITTIQTKFFEYHQNNSGGMFDINDKAGIGPRVWVEATNAADANDRAERIGIYFNGCASGLDCSCCGDRWSSAWGGDKGEDEVKPNSEYDFTWHGTVYVHRLDGTIERIKPADEQSAA